MGARITGHGELDKRKQYEQTMNMDNAGTKRVCISSDLPGDNMMLYVVSMLSVLATVSCAIAVIVITLRDHAEPVVAALAGRSIAAEAMLHSAPGVRISFRTSVRRPVLTPQLRAAA